MNRRDLFNLAVSYVCFSIGVFAAAVLPTTRARLRVAVVIFLVAACGAGLLLTLTSKGVW